MPKTFKNLPLCLGVILAISLVNYLVLAWTEPSQTPPGGNVNAPINVGNTGQSKAGGLILNTGGAAIGFVVDKGNVGIGTTVPSGKFEVSGTGNVILNTSGNVGVGTTNPGAKLEVVGQIKITGGTPGVGKILTSDENGLASWATPILPKGTTAGYGMLRGGYCTSYLYVDIYCSAISPMQCSSPQPRYCGSGMMDTYTLSCEPGFSVFITGKIEQGGFPSVTSYYTCLKN